MKIGSWAIPVLCILSLSVAGCTGEKGGRGAKADGGADAGFPTKVVKIDGSSTVYPISEAIAHNYHTEHESRRVAVAYSGSSAGMKKLIKGEIDVCDASRKIKDKEIQTFKDQGEEIVELIVAFDGLAVIVNKENTWAKCLTVAQLKSIWKPEGHVNKWNEIDKSWPDKKIALFGPGTASGTFEYFTKAINGKEKSSRSDYTASEDDDKLVVGVAGEQYSLGYFGFAYYAENKDKLSLVGVDSGDGCVKPAQDTVLNNTYKPLSRPLYLYVKKSDLARREVREFIDFYLDNVEHVLERVGYVPVSPEQLQKNKDKVKEAAASAAK